MITHVIISKMVATSRHLSPLALGIVMQQINVGLLFSTSTIQLVNKDD